MIVARIVVDDDPDQEVAAHAARAQRDRQHEPEERDEDRPRRQRREVDHRGAAHDDARVDEADERDEEADPDRDRLLQVERDRVHDLLARPCQHEDRDRDALDDDEAHGGRERQPFACDQAERDHRVEPEARSDRVGHVRVQAHQDRHHARDQAGHGQHLVERKPDLAQPLDAGEAEDLRVHEDDVRHDDERRHAGHRVASERRSVRRELEAALEQSISRSAPQSLTSALPWPRFDPCEGDNERRGGRIQR